MVALVIGAVEVVDIVEVEEVRCIFDSTPNVYFDVPSDLHFSQKIFLKAQLV